MASKLLSVISLKHFLSRRDRKIITRQGEYSNGRWLLKEKYLPKELKDIFDKSKHIEMLDSSSLYPQGESFPISDIMGYVRHLNGSFDYVSHTYKCEFMAINNFYYNYLEKYIPKFRLEAQENFKVCRVLKIFSGDDLAGLLATGIVIDTETEKENRLKGIKYIRSDNLW